jgi:hypothetical protein
MLAEQYLPEWVGVGSLGSQLLEAHDHGLQDNPVLAGSLGSADRVAEAIGSSAPERKVVVGDSVVAEGHSFAASNSGL